MILYPYGWRGKRYPLAVIAKFGPVRKMDPEFRRRVFAIMQAAGKEKKALGIGESWRSSEVQLRGFLDRHNKVDSGGCCLYQGQRYALKAHRAHMAPPGRSYHESTTPDGMCLAADMVGDLRWMNANATRFGLVHFGSKAMGSEPWHVQPHGIPNARRLYDPKTDHPLPRFPLPENP